jgi:hypothetical protein
MKNPIIGGKKAAAKDRIAKRYARMGRIVKQVSKMLGCDTCRVANYGFGSIYLIVGRYCNTAKDREKNPAAGQWYRNGVPVDFDYVAETVVASGNTEKELVASAKEYKRLRDLTMEEYLKEQAKHKKGRR